MEIEYYVTFEGAGGYWHVNLKSGDASKPYHLYQTKDKRDADLFIAQLRVWQLLIEP